MTTSDLLQRFAATIDREDNGQVVWSPQTRAKREILELAVSQTLRTILDASAKDQDELRKRATELLDSLRNAKSLADVKTILNDKESREFKLDVVVVAELEAGRLVEAAQGYLAGVVRDAETIGRSYLDQATAWAKLDKPQAAIAETLLIAAAGAELAIQEQADIWLKQQLTDSNIPHPDLVFQALKGDKKANDYLKGIVGAYAEELLKTKAIEEVTNAAKNIAADIAAKVAGTTPQTVKAMIATFQGAQNVFDTWDSKSQSERAASLLATAKTFNRLTGNNPELNKAIQYVETGMQIAQAASLMVATGGWGAVFAGMQFAGALGAMGSIGQGGGNASATSAILGAIQQLHNFVRQQFEMLNARIDNIERTLQRIEAAINLIASDVKAARREIAAVQHDLRLLQFEVTNVGRLVAQRGARLEQSKKSMLLNMRPKVVSDVLLEGFGVHAERVRNASDPLQVLMVQELGMDAAFDQINDFLMRPAGRDYSDGLPWQALLLAINVYERQMGFMAVGNTPVDFNEVISGARAFNDLYRYLLPQRRRLVKKYPGIRQALSSALEDMTQQVERARAIERVLRAPTTAQLTKPPQNRDSPLLLDLLIHLRGPLNAQVKETWQAFELQVLREIMWDALGVNEGVDKNEFKGRWGIELTVVNHLTIHDANNLKGPQHTMPMPKAPFGLVHTWKASTSVQDFQPSVELKLTGNVVMHNPHPKSNYALETPIEVRFVIRGLQGPPCSIDPQWLCYGGGRVLSAPYQFQVPIGSPPRTESTNLNIWNIADQILGYGPRPSPERLWDLLSLPGTGAPDKSDPEPREAVEMAIKSLAGGLIDANERKGFIGVEQAVSSLKGGSDAEKILAEYYQFLAEPARLLNAVNKVLSRPYEWDHLTAWHIRQVTSALTEYQRLCDTIRCVCAASMRASLEACTPLDGLVKPEYHGDPADAAALKQFYEQPVLLGAGEMSARRWSSVGKRLEVRRLSGVTFGFEQLLDEGEGYFEKCLLAIWRDATDRGSNMQMMQVANEFIDMKTALTEDPKWRRSTVRRALDQCSLTRWLFG